MGENLLVCNRVQLPATTALFTLAVTRPLPTAQQKACTGSVYRAGKKLLKLKASTMLTPFKRSGKYNTRWPASRCLLQGLRVTRSICGLPLSQQWKSQQKPLSVTALEGFLLRKVYQIRRIFATPADCSAVMPVSADL